MTGSAFTWSGADLFITRSGYTGEDGFESSVHESQAEALARAVLAQIQRYFDAIDAGDFSAWPAAVVPDRAQR